MLLHCEIEKQANGVSFPIVEGLSYVHHDIVNNVSYVLSVTSSVNSVLCIIGCASKVALTHTIQTQYQSRLETSSPSTEGWIIKKMSLLVSDGEENQSKEQSSRTCT